MTIKSDTCDGGCTCGHVRYRMTSRPMIVHCCHCTWCQRETGSAFAINALIEADRVQLLEGAVEDVDTPTSSGQPLTVWRCPKCQVAVWSNYSLPGGLASAVRFVRVGTLDKPNAMPPDIHIFTSSKQPWVILPSEDQAVEEYYSARDIWPEASLARRAALLKSV